MLSSLVGGGSVSDLVVPGLPYVKRLTLTAAPAKLSFGHQTRRITVVNESATESVLVAFGSPELIVGQAIDVKPNTCKVLDVRVTDLYLKSSSGSVSCGILAELTSGISFGTGQGSSADLSVYVEQLPLTAFYRDFTGEGSWVGTPSGGPSGTRTLSSTGVAPVVSPLNGHGAALRNGEGYFDSGLPLSDFVDESSFSIWHLIQLNAIGTGDMRGVSDADEYIITATLFISQLKVFYVGNWSTPNGDYDDVRVDADVNKWFLLQTRFNGTLLQARVNGGPWVSKASSVPGIESLEADLYVGRITGTGGSLSIAEAAISKSFFDDATFDLILDYARSRYGLTL